MTASHTPPKHSVSVAAAIIDDQDRFLVVRRADNGSWEPPGGVLELGESIEDGLVREVEEETGLTVRPIALTGVYKNMPCGIIALVFRCEIAGGAARVTPEADAVCWVHRALLTDHMTDAYSVRMLDAARLGVPSVRAHDGVHILASSVAMNVPRPQIDEVARLSDVSHDGDEPSMTYEIELHPPDTPVAHDVFAA